MKRAVVSTLLRDGDYIPASAYSNRVLVFTVLVEGTSKDNLATNLQTLARELDRQNNILKYQSEGATNPVFFRTSRSPEYDIVGEAFDETVNRRQLRLKVIAEPFAYGLRVDQGAVTVNNDPAHATNPCRFDVTGVTGDVPTPGFFRIDPGTAGATLRTLLAVRRHGTPGGVYTFQCESMTQGTDTTVQVNDATMSGAGNNYSRTTFVTATMQARLTVGSFPAVASTDIRGTYRIFARLRKSVAADAINIEIQLSGPFIITAKVATPSTTLRHWLDLGLITIPPGSDPVQEGYSNVAQAVEASILQLRAERTSGSGNLDWDVVMAVPADEFQGFAIVAYTGANLIEIVCDGPLDSEYYRTISTGQIYTGAAIPSRVGAYPLLMPNQTNRIAFLLGVYGAGVAADDITLSTSVTVSFWPRWLYIRP